MESTEDAPVCSTIKARYFVCGFMGRAVDRLLLPFFSKDQSAEEDEVVKKSASTRMNPLAGGELVKYSEHVQIQARSEDPMPTMTKPSLQVQLDRKSYPNGDADVVEATSKAGVK